MAEEGLHRRLAAILMADVVGYSRLMEADEAGTLRAVKQHRRNVIDPAVAAHRGRVVKLMGDGILVEFISGCARGHRGLLSSLFATSRCGVPPPPFSARQDDQFARLPRKQAGAFRDLCVASGRVGRTDRHAGANQRDRQKAEAERSHQSGHQNFTRVPTVPTTMSSTLGASSRSSEYQRT
jgi:hypothetical protein